MMSSQRHGAGKVAASLPKWQEWPPCHAERSEVSRPALRRFFAVLRMTNLAVFSAFSVGRTPRVQPQLVSAFKVTSNPLRFQSVVVDGRLDGYT